MADPVVIPLLNSNEPEARIAAVHVQEGQLVAPGDPLCTVETTKATAEVTAESQGYIVALRLQPGQMAQAGELFCYLADSPHWLPPENESTSAESPAQADIPPGLRITQPALALARHNRLDLSKLPTGTLVTENMVRSLLAKATPGIDFSLPEVAFDSNAILIFGGGGHGKMVIDLLRLSGAYRIAGILDDGLTPGSTVMGIQVLGGKELLPNLHTAGVRLAVNAVGGIGNIGVRINIFRMLSEAGFAFPVLIHRAAFVEASANLAPGAQVFARAYVGSQAQIGFGSIINTGVIVSHDCQIGEYVNISPGALLAGEVAAGAGVLIGMGVTINLGVQIGRGSRIGNGATVKADVPEGSMVRAGSIWPPD